MRIGAYPGTSDPPTVAHLAVAEAALNQGGLDAVHLVVSRAPLGKTPSVPSLDDRLAVLEDVASTRDWLEIKVTEHRLIADVAAGYDAVIMGMDKWLQVLDPAWYGGSTEARDAALGSLPPVLLAARRGSSAPDLDRSGVRVLDVHPGHGPVSSTLVRAGRVEWMLEEAARFDERTGAWSDPERYRAGGCRDCRLDRASLPPDAWPGHPRLTDLYAAGILLIVAQILGIYALFTRKADLIFALTMAVILLVAVVLGGYGVYHRLH